MPVLPFYSQWQARLDPREAAVVEPVTAFARDVIAPLARDPSAQCDGLPRAIVAQWSALGMLGLEVPVERGGLGASYFAKIRVVQELARWSFACAFALNNMQSVAVRVARFGNDEQRARLLPSMLSGERIAAFALTEPGAGSDLAALSTTARRVAGGWILDGEKAWIANGTIVDTILVLAQTGSGAKGVAGFLVDLKAEGVERQMPHAVTTGRALGLAGVRLGACFVPDRDLIHAPGDAFRIALGGINGARVHVAAMCTAMLEHSLAIAVDHAGRRRAFDVPVLSHQGLRWQLADVATELEAADQLVYRAATLIAAGQDASLAAAHAKKFAVGVAERGIAACMQAMGAEGLLGAHPLARHLAEVRMAAYADGTTEMQNERIGQLLAAHHRLPPD